MNKLTLKHRILSFVSFMEESVAQEGRQFEQFQRCFIFRCFSKFIQLLKLNTVFTGLLRRRFFLEISGSN